MSHIVSVTLTDDDLDILDALHHLEGVRGRAPMVRIILRERFDTVMARDAQVRELVRLRREQRAEQQGQQRFRLIQGGKRQ